MVTPIFDHAYSKTVKWLLAFLNLHHHAKNQLILLIHFWDMYSRFRVLWPNWPHPITFLPTFNLFEFASTCKKSGYFTDLFWGYGWLKKSFNLIGWEHCVLYIRSKNFPKYEISAGTQQIIKIFIAEQIQ